MSAASDARAALDERRRGERDGAAMTDADLTAAIHAAASNWAPFTPRPDHLAGLVHVETARRAAREADLHAVTAEVLSYEPTPTMSREVRPNLAVRTDGEWSTIAVLWGGYSSPVERTASARRWNVARRRYRQRVDAHQSERAFRDSLVRRRGLVTTREAREVAPDLLDGHAYALASHYVDADGIERRHELPLGARHNRSCKLGKSCQCGGAIVRIGAVAQAPDARATARVSVQWHGGTGRIEDADAGAVADGTRSERHAGTALTSRADGCNATVTDADGTRRRARLVHLRADGALWMHAVAGTVPPERLATLDAHAIVGHIEVDAQRRFTDYVVVHDVLVRQADGTYATSTRVRPPVSASAVRILPTYPRPGAIVTSADGYVTSDPRPALGRPMAFTARLVRATKDQRTEADRPVEQQVKRRQHRAEQLAHTRLETAKMASIEALASGVLTGRSDATHVRLTRAAATVTLLSSWLTVHTSARALVLTYEPATQ